MGRVSDVTFLASVDGCRSCEPGSFMGSTGAASAWAEGAERRVRTWVGLAEGQRGFGGWRRGMRSKPVGLLCTHWCGWKAGEGRYQAGMYILEALWVSGFWPPNPSCLILVLNGQRRNGQEH